MNMKKTAIAAGMLLAMGPTGANAAFTGGDGSYTMTITSGCFNFGPCTPGGTGDYADNTNTVDTDLAWAGLTGGSGIANDGKSGIIDFTLSGGSITVTSFSMDSYLVTSGGTFYMRGGNLGTMGGSIDAAGNVLFDPTGRVGLAAGVDTIEKNWNLDDSTNVSGGTVTGLFEPWTTGTSTSLKKLGTLPPAQSSTGSILVDNGSGGWDGTLVSTGNVGNAWGSGFTGIIYNEEFNVTVTPNAIPVPAAVWLFGSGLVGLVGVARRRKNA